MNQYSQQHTFHHYVTNQRTMLLLWLADVVGVFVGVTPKVTGDAVVVGFAVSDEDGLRVGLDIVS